MSSSSPSRNRPTPEIIKVDDYVEYQLVGDRVELLEIAFHKYAIAREWENLLSLWGGQTTKPHQIKRNAMVKNGY